MNSNNETTENNYLLQGTNVAFIRNDRRKPIEVFLIWAIRIITKLHLKYVTACIKQTTEQSFYTTMKNLNILNMTRSNNLW